MSLTQYLESQEDQENDKTTQFPRTQERKREGGFVCLGMKERVGLYSSDGGNMNGMQFNEG